MNHFEVDKLHVFECIKIEFNIFQSVKLQMIKLSLYSMEFETFCPPLESTIQVQITRSRMRIKGGELRGTMSGLQAFRSNGKRLHNRPLDSQSPRMPAI